MRLIIVIALVAVVGVGVLISVFSVQRFSVENPAELPIIEKEPKEVRLVFVGDIMLSRAIGKLMIDKKDYSFPFASTTEFIRSADIAFANLENPVSTGGIRSGSIYSFRADPQVVPGLKSAGFDVVSIANNHIWDYGKQAFRDTLVHLSLNDITAVGGGESYDGAHMPKVMTVGDTRIAFLAYTNLLPESLGLASSTPAVALFDTSLISTYVA